MALAVGEQISQPKIRFQLKKGILHINSRLDTKYYNKRNTINILKPLQQQKPIYL